MQGRSHALRNSRAVFALVIVGRKFRKSMFHARIHAPQMNASKLRNKRRSLTGCGNTGACVLPSKAKSPSPRKFVRRSDSCPTPRSSLMSWTVKRGSARRRLGTSAKRSSLEQSHDERDHGSDAWEAVKTLVDANIFNDPLSSREVGPPR